MKSTRLLHAAAVTIAITITAAAAGIAITAPHPTATIVLPQIVISAHRLPVHQLSAVTITGKRLRADEKTRIAAASGTVTAS